MDTMSDSPASEPLSATPANNPMPTPVQLYLGSDKGWITLNNARCIGCSEPLPPPDPTELGIPPTLAEKLIHGTFSGRYYGDRWTKYQVELVGTVVGVYDPYYGKDPIVVPAQGIAGEPSAPGSPQLVQLWLRRIHYIDSPVYLEARWHPYRTRMVSIRGLELSHRKAHVDAAWKAIKLTEGRPGPKQKPLNARDRSLVRRAKASLAGKVSLRDTAQNLQVSKSRLERLLAHPDAQGGNPAQ
jgi:hypothetical protein